VHIRSIFGVAVPSSGAGRGIAVPCHWPRAVPFTNARRIMQRARFRHRMSVPFVPATASHEQSPSHGASHSCALHACRVQMQQSSQTHLATQQCVQPDRPKACAFGFAPRARGAVGLTQRYKAPRVRALRKWRDSEVVPSAEDPKCQHPSKLSAFPQPKKLERLHSSSLSAYPPPKESEVVQSGLLPFLKNSRGAVPVVVFGAAAYGCQR